MINHKTKWITLGICAALCTGLGTLVTGCGGSEEDQAPVVKRTPVLPPPPEKPTLTPVAQLMVELNIDKRVVLPEDKAPDNDPARKAVLLFFDAMARGNAESLKGMLSEPDKHELDALVASGQWKDTAAKIHEIDVETGMGESNQCALGIIEVGTGAQTAYEPQLWYYTFADDVVSFESAPTPPGIIDKLTGDKIAVWHKILADELALADKPEDDVELAQVNLDAGDEPGGASQETGGKPSGPGGLRPGGGGAPIAPPSAPRPGGHP